MADWLGLGAAGRINTPSTLGGNNWRWRLKAEQLTSDLAKKFAKKPFCSAERKNEDLSKVERSFLLDRKKRIC